MTLRLILLEVLLYAGPLCMGLRSLTAVEHERLSMKERLTQGIAQSMKRRIIYLFLE